MNNLLHASLVSNKTPENCNIGKNCRVVGISATDSPWRNADKNVINNQRTAKISSASAFTSTIHGCTDHVLTDTTVVDKRTIALWTGNDW